MCGILGFSGDYTSLPYVNDLTRDSFSDQFHGALSTLRNRGPDAEAVNFLWESKVFLGHTRLAIQDLSLAGIQPMLSSDGNTVITFNGEIYNFPELKIDLLSQGYEFKSNTDTEVILNLYDKYGLECFKMLDGIFALAIFDINEDSLFLARDGLGVKPLYYYNDDSKFIFGSEIKALTYLLDGQNLSLDEQSINRYLTFQWCPGEGTPFKEVKKQNSGEILVVKHGKIVKSVVFKRLPMSYQLKKESNNSVGQVIAGLDKNLRKAVHDQMLSDAPVGAFLSGGLDSTSIVAFAKEKNPDIVCFTIDTQNQRKDKSDDLPYAKAAAKSLNVDLEIVTIDSDSIVRNLEKMVWLLDEPLGDPAPLNVLYISELAQKNGLKVLLSGAGGDDILTGYRRHQAIMYDGKLQMLPRSILSALEQITGRLDKRVTLFRRLAKLFNGSSLSGDARIINYFKWVDNHLLTTLYTDAFREEAIKDLAEQPMIDFLSTAHPSCSDLDRMLGLEQRFFTTDHNLLYTDKMSMAVGIEVRVPLLANNLVEFAATIPDEMKQKGREGKWIFKKTMEAYLPKSLIYRPKTGFGAPLQDWLRVELKDYVFDLLGHRSLKARGIFDPDAVTRLIERNNSGEIEVSYTIFSLLCIEIWCRQNLDSNMAEKKIMPRSII